MPESTGSEHSYVADAQNWCAPLRAARRGARLGPADTLSRASLSLEPRALPSLAGSSA